jgi:hypothetical protein
MPIVCARLPVMTEFPPAKQRAKILLYLRSPARSTFSVDIIRRKAIIQNARHTVTASLGPPLDTLTFAANCHPSHHVRANCIVRRVPTFSWQRYEHETPLVHFVSVQFRGTLAEGVRLGSMPSGRFYSSFGKNQLAIQNRKTRSGFDGAAGGDARDRSIAGRRRSTHGFILQHGTRSPFRGTYQLVRILT